MMEPANTNVERNKLSTAAALKKGERKSAQAGPDVFTEEIPLSSLRTKDTQITRLSFADRHLIPLDINIDGEVATMTYHIAGLRPLDDIRKESEADKYRLLFNVGELAKLAEHYDFALNPDNLYYDRNLSVRILRRDILADDTESEFTAQYRCLCGHVLQNRYSYTDYQNGGLSLLKKNRLLKEIYEAENDAQIASSLGNWYDAQSNKVKRTKRLIGRKTFVLLVAALIFSMVFAVASAAYSATFLLVEQPYEARLMQASNAYLLDDYDGVITAVQNDNVSNLPKETRYILARSYVQAESLSQQQKNNILPLLTMKTEDTLINYWIELGRRNYDQARDIAERIQNDEWLLYCLLKQEVDVRNDTAISGAEKTSQLDALNREIEALSKKLDEQGTQDKP